MCHIEQRVFRLEVEISFTENLFSLSRFLGSLRSLRMTPIIKISLCVILSKESLDSKSKYLLLKTYFHFLDSSARFALSEWHAYTIKKLCVVWSNTLISQKKSISNWYTLFVLNYLLLIASIGLFLEIFVVGSKLARNAEPQLTNKIKITWRIPALRSAIE